MILASLTLPPRDSFNNPQPLPEQYVSRVSLPFPGTVIITASTGTVIDAYSTGGTLLGSGTSSLSFSTTESNIVIVFTKPSAGIITVELLPVVSDRSVPTPPGSGDVLTSTGTAPSDYGWAPPDLSATALQGVAISSAAPTDGQVLEYDGTEWVPTNPGGLLARKSYNTASTVSYSLGISMAAVDPTNLSVTFTAPSSGNVLVALEGLYVIPYPVQVYGGVISSGSQLGSSQSLISSNNSGSNVLQRLIATLMATGLTAAASYTFDFAAYGNSPGATLQLGGALGSASIAVWEAP